METHLINQTYDKEKWKRAMEAAMDAINCVETSETTGAYTMDGRRLGLSINTNSSVTDQSERGRINYTYVFTGDGNSTQFLNQNEYLMSMNKSSSITYTATTVRMSPGQFLYESFGRLPRLFMSYH